MKIVIALGGNMISDAKNKTESFESQKTRIANSAEIISDIIELGHDVIITHGNGPQVGSLLLQQEAKISGSVSLPLHILGALTQGQIGVLLQHALTNEFHKRGIDKPVAVIPSTVLVSEDDPGFSDPSKPVGSYFDEERLKDFIKEEPNFQYITTEDGYRKVVPSPQPLEILEKDIIDLLSNTHLVIAIGGGGTPAVQLQDRIEMKDAVIDKDLASSLLAKELNADLLMILTNVEGVYRNFNKENQEFISEISHDNAKLLIQSGQVSKGSMEPKIRAGLLFTKGETIITTPEKAVQALDGNAGTRITNQF